MSKEMIKFMLRKYIFLSFANVKDDFLKFSKDKELIAHNLSFDLGFINHELSFELTNKMTDTLSWLKKLFRTCDAA